REYKNLALDKVKDLQQRFPQLASRQLEIMDQELLQSQAQSLEEMESSEVITPAVKTVLFGELKQQHQPER
ncbi:MAG: hypothetical protein V1879_02315, partial [Pseudomonadota bacterium]